MYYTITIVTPLTHTTEVRTSPVGVDTTKSYPKSSMDTPIMSTNFLAMKVCLLPKLNKAMEGAEWINRIHVIKMASSTTSSIVVAYILPCYSGLAPCFVFAHPDVLCPTLVPEQHPLQLIWPASAGPNGDRAATPLALLNTLLCLWLLVASPLLPLRLGRW